MTKQHFIFLIICIFLSQQNANAQLKNYQFSQLDSLQKLEKRSVIIFIHTDWCNYCQMMKNTTFKNNLVIQELNNNYYFIDLNAEEKSVIQFGGHLYKFKPSGLNTGIHELAEKLASINDKVSYPTVCVLNPNFEITTQYNGFMDINYFLSLIRN